MGRGPLDVQFRLGGRGGGRGRALGGGGVPGGRGGGVVAGGGLPELPGAGPAAGVTHGVVLRVLQPRDQPLVLLAEVAAHEARLPHDHHVLQ